MSTTTTANFKIILKSGLLKTDPISYINIDPYLIVSFE